MWGGGGGSFAHKTRGQRMGPKTIPLKLGVAANSFPQFLQYSPTSPNNHVHVQTPLRSRTPVPVGHPDGRLLHPANLEYDRALAEFVSGGGSM